MLCWMSETRLEYMACRTMKPSLKWVPHIILSLAWFLLRYQATLKYYCAAFKDNFEPRLIADWLDGLSYGMALEIWIEQPDFTSWLGTEWKRKIHSSYILILHSDGNSCFHQGMKENLLSSLGVASASRLVWRLRLELYQFVGQTQPRLPRIVDWYPCAIALRWYSSPSSLSFSQCILVNKHTTT